MRSDADLHWTANVAMGSSIGCRFALGAGNERRFGTLNAVMLSCGQRVIGETDGWAITRRAAAFAGTGLKVTSSFVSPPTRR